jgi:hypothetical protein
MSDYANGQLPADPPPYTPPEIPDPGPGYDIPPPVTEPPPMEVPPPEPPAPTPPPLRA